MCKLLIHAFPSGIASAQRVLGRGRFPNLFVLIYCRSTLLIAPAIVQLAWLEIVGQKLLISHGFTLTAVLKNLFFMGASGGEIQKTPTCCYLRLFVAASSLHSCSFTGHWVVFNSQTHIQVCANWTCTSTPYC